jgi:glycosyltransferase involved in cell wall biosynthesis
MLGLTEPYCPLSPSPLMNESTAIIVSVVIPSLNRPQLVSQSVKSALAQTMESIEVIVIIDGPDPATILELNQIEDPRLRVIQLPTNIGPAGARNTGVREAEGTWIAFLDDDDKWLPQKLQLQLDLAHKSKYASPIVSSRFLANTSKGEFIWPTRLPTPSESVAEYLFIRNSLFLGEAFIVTPTILARKELLEKIPFNQNLPRHEDLDWLIHASLNPDVGLEFVGEPTASVNMIYTQARQSLSNVNDWKYSLEWIRSVRESIAPQAYSGFIIAVVGPQAAIGSNWQAFLPLLWEAFRYGRLRFFDLFLYLLMWLVPQDLRQQVRSLFARKKDD